MVALLLITTCHGQFWRAEDGRVPVALASAECGTGGDGNLSPAPSRGRYCCHVPDPRPGFRPPASGPLPAEEPVYAGPAEDQPFIKALCHACCMLSGDHLARVPAAFAR